MLRHSFDGRNAANGPLSSMLPNDWLLVTWTALTVVGTATLVSDFLRGLVLHGKQRSTNVVSNLPFQFISKLEMKKSAWTWFYTAGCFWNVFLFYLVYFQPESAMTQSMLRWLQASDDASTPLVVRNEVVVFMACFAVQSTRRFLECLFVTQFGKARMHVSVLIIGFTHYLLIGVSVLSDKDALNDKEPDNVRASATRLGLALFALGSYHQFMCNHLLAKQKAANKMRHVLPRGDWFELTRSPLYTTEILIYLAFLFITGGTTISLYFVFIWVFANQAICAHNNYNWYEDKFRDRLAELPKYKLIPYIW